MADPPDEWHTTWGPGKSRTTWETPGLRRTRVHTKRHQTYRTYQGIPGLNPIRARALRSLWANGTRHRRSSMLHHLY